jgi:SAM-dependent methyltransferase
VAAVEHLAREMRTDEPSTSDQQRASHRAGHPDIIAAVFATPGPAPVAGNVYDKYATANPVVRRLMGSFLASLDALVARAAPRSLLDVGCGEGIVTRRLALSLPAGGRAIGLDVESPRLREAWAAGAGDCAARVDYVIGDAQALPFRDDEFDLVSLVEMLQLVHDPGRALVEAARVARSAVIVTVPREPLWRMLNVARGAYVPALGDTPGHLHHWSRRAIVDLVSARARVVSVCSTLPWTLILARPG